MYHKKHSRADDLQDLKILHLLDNEGLTGTVVAERIHDMTRSGILAVRNRVNAEHDKHPCACRRKANRDGGMPSRWWAA